MVGATAPSALAGTGSIAGNVTGAPSHAPVGGVEVCALKTTVEGEIPVENKNHCDFTTADGNYEIGSLDSGTYLPLFSPRVEGQNYLRRYYNSDGQWPPDSVTVGDGATTGIDTELPEGGTVKGRVTEELEGQPLAGVRVCAGQGWENREQLCVSTDAKGDYEIVGLATDIYTLEFDPEDSGLQYFGEYYDDQIFGNGHIQQPVSVTAGSVVDGIAAVLTPAAEIRGVVTSAWNGAPLSHTLVCIAPPDSFFETSSFADQSRCSRTKASGSYSINNLRTGQYKVLFSLELREFLNYLPPVEPEEDGYPTRYWDEESTLAAADVLNLAGPTVVSGIDARLGPSPAISIASPPPAAVLPAVKRKCKAGHHLRKIKGKSRCVRRHPRKHRRHRHSHRSASRPS